jgi:hypothetical protein
MSKWIVAVGLLSLIALTGCSPKEEVVPPSTPNNNAQQVVPGAAGQPMAGASDVRPPMKPGR